MYLKELTPGREKKFRDALKRRQPDLTVIFENIEDPHNIMAMLRTCDAVGIMDVHVVNKNRRSRRIGKKSSASAQKWVNTHFYDEPEPCINALKEKGFSIWATHLGTEGKTLYDVDMAQPIALVFGNEWHGVSEGTLAMCDGNFIVPMVGMIPSLNVSVACAVSLYEAYRQRAAAGKYNEMQISPEQAQAIYAEWIWK
jgi:tRNA (guanosine-2'-O-)-methyltransferase